MDGDALLDWLRAAAPEVRHELLFARRSSPGDRVMLHDGTWWVLEAWVSDEVSPPDGPGVLRMARLRRVWGPW